MGGQNSITTMRNVYGVLCCAAATVPFLIELVLQGNFTAEHLMYAALLLVIMNALIFTAVHYLVSKLPHTAIPSDTTATLSAAPVKEAQSNSDPVDHVQSDQHTTEQDLSRAHMLLNALIHSADFEELIYEYHHFEQNGFKAILASGLPMHYKMKELLHVVYQLKEQFNHMEMNRVASRLAELEQSMNRIAASEALSEDEVEQFLSAQKWNEWLQEDLEFIESSLGKEFFSRSDVLSIHFTHIDELKEQIVKLLNPYETAKMLQAVERLHYQPFKALLRTHRGFVEHLAGKFGKQIFPLEIIGGDFMVDPSEYRDFTRAIKHVLRNMVEHGIESPEQRVAAGKNPQGLITLNAERSGEWVELTITDDGRGLDFPKIRQVCVNKHIIDASQADTVPNEVIIDSIFIDGFTTKISDGIYTGRGAGLSVIKEMISKAEGMCGVKTEEGRGTTFIFHMPGPKSFHIDELEMEALLQPTVECSSSLLEGSFGLHVSSVELETVQSLKLRDFSSLLHIRGLVEGIFMLSVDKEAAEHMVRQYVVGAMSDEELQGYLLDVIGECSNLMMGGISHLRAESDEWLRMATPITTNAPGIELRYPDGQMWIATLQTQLGPISLGFVVLNN